MSYAQDTSISIDRQIKFSFNITKEEYETMLSFSEDDKVRFLYVITHHNEDGSFNLGYSGKKTASSLREAISYFGSSTDIAFQKNTIRSNRARYKFNVVCYCKNKNELGYGENDLIAYMKDFYKDRWVNKALKHGNFTIDGLISICKENHGLKYIRKDELETYLNAGWYVGGNSKGLLAIYKDSHNKFVKKEDLEGYLNDGWERGTTLKSLITLKKDNVFIRVKQEELKFYTDAGWLRIGSSKGLIGINKNNEVKYVREEDLESYLNDGWLRGGLNRGDIVMSKGEKISFVSLEEVSKYEEEGWVKGNLYKRGLVRIVKDGIQKRVKKEVLAEYLSNGWVILQKKIYAKLRFKIVKEGETKEVFSFELKSHYDEGWELKEKPKYQLKGVGKKKLNLSVTKDGEIKLIPIALFNEYQEHGWVRLPKRESLIAITKEGVGKKVSREDLDSYYKEGWVKKKKTLTEEDKLNKKIAANRPEVKERQRLNRLGRTWFNNGKEEIWLREEEFNALPNKEIWVNGRLPLSKEEKENKSRQNKYICPYCFKYISSGCHVADHIAKEHPLEVQWKDLDKKEREDKYRAIKHLELDIVKNYFDGLEKSRKIRYKEPTRIEPVMSKREEPKRALEDNNLVVGEYCNKRRMYSLF